MGDKKQKKADLPDLKVLFQGGEVERREIESDFWNLFVWPAAFLLLSPIVNTCWVLNEIISYQSF